ncbi:MlaA family lipoprotein [Simplicispira psychrophila]|uniref:MlaA family lipoprotein n=1 Tax=Simplicispira psychrophila TaxID=80882 RepID=UPI0004894B72|nr:VacJ family lipoprotein [Simplicispira psychrophila]
MTSFLSAGAACPSESPRRASLARAAICAVFALVLAGCANGPANDPFERYNRGTIDFNESLDAMVLKPVAETYQEVTPVMARTGVSNFFSNLGDAWSFVNNLLQLRPEPAMNSLVRFNVNTLFGLGGLLDVASEMGVDRYKQDLGQTLGRWGVPTGPYVVLPILGSSTVRDTLTLPLSWRGNLISQVESTTVSNSLYALSAVNTRANLLRASAVLDSAALDKYSFMRDVYMRVRRQDGAPPEGSKADDDSGADEGILPNEPY